MILGKTIKRIRRVF